MTNPRRSAIKSIAAVALLCGAGCTQRTIEVTSEPPGALVWINDAEVGRTPLQADFRFFGTYDVRVRLDGYEPIYAGMKAQTPLHEQPGIDLLAAPSNLKTLVQWHFVLVPSPESGDKRAAQYAAVQRANAFREKSAGGEAGQ